MAGHCRNCRGTTSHEGGRGGWSSRSRTRVVDCNHDTRSPLLRLWRRIELTRNGEDDLRPGGQAEDRQRERAELPGCPRIALANLHHVHFGSSCEGRGLYFHVDYDALTPGSVARNRWFAVDEALMQGLGPEHNLNELGRQDDARTRRDKMYASCISKSNA